jgi:Transglycosylase SLT domain
VPRRGHVTTREIDHAADAYGIDRGIFRRLVRQESGGQIDIGSPKGARGPTQLMPDTARALGVNPEDPIDNLRGGAKYLRQQLDAFKGSYRLALAAYNAGPGNVHHYGGVPPFGETQHYVSVILGGRSLTDQGRAAGARADRHGQGGGGQSSGMDRGTAKLINQILGKSVTIPGAAAEDPLGRDSTSETMGAISALRRHDILGFAGGINNARALDEAASAPSDSITIPGTSVKVPASALAPGGGGGGGKGGGSTSMPSGTARFDGKNVAAWIRPALVYARNHGWKGSVVSGLRSHKLQAQLYDDFIHGRRAGPVAKPGQSNHEGTDFPRGAVDVSDPQQLNAILRNSPFRSKLQWAGSADLPHFSHHHDGSF